MKHNFKTLWRKVFDTSITDEDSIKVAIKELVLMKEELLQLKENGIVPITLVDAMTGKMYIQINELLGEE